MISLYSIDSQKEIPFLSAFFTKTAFALAFVSLFLYSSICLADDASAENKKNLEKLLAAIQERVNATGTVSCSFEQERILSIFSHPIVFTGKMALSRPDNLRWENIDPIPSVLIFAGDKGMRCNDDAPPVHFELEKDPIMKMVAEQIWTWANGNYGSLRDKYSISLVDENEILLLPVTNEFGDVITSVRVGFDSTSLQPRTIHIQEAGGDSTAIHFTGYELNKPVDDELFTTCYP